MTIHSELIYEITKEENLPKIVFQRPPSFRLMPLDYVNLGPQSENWVPISPDILVKLKDGRNVAVEIESDMQYDFDSSMRQIGKYLKKYDGVSVIIPSFYSKYAGRYQNEGIRVFLWSAQRVWECMECEKETIDHRSIKPKCIHCKSNQLRLKGISNLELDLVSS